MPVKNFPFLPLDGILRPLLPIVILNPHTGKSFKTYGFIDTGADSCTLPADLAGILGHDLKKGKQSTAETVGGEAITWLHTTTIQMLNNKGEQFYEICNAHVEYVENFDYVIIGVNDFLSNFRLEIDYPNKCFSLRYSKKKIKISAP